MPHAAKKKSPAGPLLFVLLWMLMASGCATVFNRHTDNMDLTSDPTGAFVTLDEGTITCTTPCHLQFTEKKTIIPGTIGKRGYQSQEISVRRPIHWGFWADLAFGLYGLPGMAIDWLTGSMRGYRNLHVQLEKGDDSLQLKPVDVHVLYPEEKISDKIRELRPDLETATRKTALDEIYRRLANEQSAGRKLDLDALIQEVLAATATAHPAASHNAALVSIQEKYPEAFVLETMRTYYGTSDKGKEAQIMEGIYQQLLAMAKMGERLDLDEAIRREMQGITPP